MRASNCLLTCSCLWLVISDRRLEIFFSNNPPATVFFLIGPFLLVAFLITVVVLLLQHHFISSSRRRRLQPCSPVQTTLLFLLLRDFSIGIDLHQRFSYHRYTVRFSSVAELRSPLRELSHSNWCEWCCLVGKDSNPYYSQTVSCHHHTEVSTLLTRSSGSTRGQWRGH